MALASPPAELQRAIDAAAEAYRVPADLLAGIWRRESGGTFPNPAVNSSGYGGLFGTRNWNASTQAQATQAASILAAGFKASGGDVAGALSYYNTGKTSGGYTSVPGQTTFGNIKSAVGSAVNAISATVAQIAKAIVPTGANVNLNGVDPSLLGRLYALSTSLGKSIYVTSGYRTPAQSAALGESRTDPHTRGIAVDAGIASSTGGFIPLGDVVPQATLAKFGLFSGNTAGFDPTKPGGFDPVHIQLEPATVTPGFSPTTANASLGGAVSGWLKRAQGWLQNPAGPIIGIAEGAAGAIGGAIGGVFDPGSIVSGVEGWVTDKAGYAAVYLLLVSFALVLALLGVLSILGIHPRTAVAGGAARLLPEAAAV